MTGVSGNETERAKVIAEALREYCSDVSIDRLGSVIGLRKGGGAAKLMYVAHADEIGLMVIGIDDRGFLTLEPIGGIDKRTLPAQEVTVFGKEKLFGVIGIKPPHLTSPSEAKTALTFEELTVDVGLPAEKVRELVSIGDLVTINRSAVELQNNRLAGKCFDDTAGIASLLYSLECLKDVKLDVDLYIVATVQEEISYGGGYTATYSINPDIGIAVDVTGAKAENHSGDTETLLGKGPDISCGPNINRRIYKRLKETGEKAGIPMQFSVEPGMSGTDAVPMQVTRNGVITGLVSIPLKYMHTSVEVVDLNDIKETGRLLAEFARSFNGIKTEEYLCF